MKWLCALGGVASVAVAGCAADSGTGFVQPTQAPAVRGQAINVQPAQSGVRTAASNRSNKLTDREITSLLSGKSIKQVDDQFTAYFDPQGGISAEYYNASQKGNWRVASGKLCQSFAEWNGGQPTCFDVLRGNGGLYRFHDTSNNDGYTFRVR